MKDSSSSDTAFRLDEATIDDLHRAIRAGQVTCVEVVRQYIARARAYNGVSSTSLFHAEQTDRERREREFLVRALAAADGNKAEAARALDLPRSTFLSRLKKHGLA